jgi:hypothetical protein
VLDRWVWTLGTNCASTGEQRLGTVQQPIWQASLFELVALKRPPMRAYSKFERDTYLREMLCHLGRLSRADAQIIDVELETEEVIL